jgi:hypothetical protein
MLAEYRKRKAFNRAVTVQKLCGGADPIPEIP